MKRQWKTVLIRAAYTMVSAATSALILNETGNLDINMTNFFYMIALTGLSCILYSIKDLLKIKGEKVKK